MKPAMRPILLWLCCLAAAPAQAETTWHFMSRHGECTDMTTTLRHKLGDFPAVTSPGALVKALKQRGLEAQVAPLPDAGEGFLLAQVPAKGWSLVLARRDRCTHFSPGPK
jgi:hypothetical protein